MTPAQLDKLKMTADLIEDWKHLGIHPNETLTRLITEHGASYRFVQGTFILRACGVVSTSADGGQDLLDHWQTAATLRIVQA